MLIKELAAAADKAKAARINLQIAMNDLSILEGEVFLKSLVLKPKGR